MQALADIRILDFSHVIAGPFCTYQLGLLGADVIKVEEPGAGDYMRRRGSVTAWRADLMGDHFAIQNGNKRSIVLDLKNPAGLSLARRMAEGADVVIDNFRPGVMARLGLDHATLRVANPRLVSLSLSGFGAQGPLRERPAYDNVIQAFSGLMAMTGTTQSGPLKAGAPILDYASGTMAAFAVTSALLRRERAGVGQHIDLSMLDTAFMLMSPAISGLLNGGKVTPLHGNDHALAAASCYESADGSLIMLGCCTQRQFEILCHKIGRADLLEDSRFADVRRQDPWRSELAQILAAEMRCRTAAEWEASLSPEIPAARVRGLEEALLDADAAGAGVVRHSEEQGSAEQAAVPVAAFSADADGPAWTAAAPRLGQHRDAILTEFGIGAAEQSELLRCGAFGAQDEAAPPPYSS